MGKCKNCRNGNVDGGFHVRLGSEIVDITNEKNSKISEVREKDKDKRVKILSEISEHYKGLLNKKYNELPKRISKCGYCIIKE